MELYNLEVPGRGKFWYRNGWCVFEYRDGCRGRRLIDMGEDEQAARQYAHDWNHSV